MLCAPTEEEAEFLGSSRDVNKAGTVMGLQRGLLPPEEAVGFPLSEEAKRFMAGFRKGYVDGTPEQVRDGLLEVAGRYRTDDVSVVTNPYAHEVRVRSYELVAAALGLERPPEA